MKITAEVAPQALADVDAVLVPAFSSGELAVSDPAAIGLLPDGLSAALRRHARKQLGSTVLMPSLDGTSPDYIAVNVGEPSDPSVYTLRSAVLRGIRSVQQQRVASLLHLVPHVEDSCRVVTEALVSGSYVFDRYRTTPSASSVEEILVPWADLAVVADAVIRGECAAIVRDLVNTPASDLTPLDLGRYCSEAAETYGFDCRVISGQDLAETGFGGIIAVGKGSINPPALIELRYRLDGRPPICLVGKGITFDTGGLALKDIAGMLPMKQDMAGAASVLAAIIAAARLGLDLPILGVLACAENQPGPGAVMPGDIITHRGGKTSEVRDPDAEGRLVVADALAMVAEEEAECIVDVTTLTGSTGLGTDLWGVMANTPELARELVDAGERSGEPGWELPLWAGYRADVVSEIADLKNLYPPHRYNASAILGGLYLQEFIGEHPWAHIDMCAQAFEENADRNLPIGATGNPTQALIEFLLGRARARGSDSRASTPGTAP